VTKQGREEREKGRRRQEECGEGSARGNVRFFVVKGPYMTFTNFNDAAFLDKLYFLINHFAFLQLKYPSITHGTDYSRIVLNSVIKSKK